MHNRDLWVIEQLHRDRSLTVSGARGRVRLPAEYVTSDVELGYAQTAHGAQGRTVDRSLTLIDGPVDARGINVPMTRGRESNTAYVAVEPGGSGRDVLAAGLSRDWIDRPALEVLNEIQRPAPSRPAMLSPQALRGLWDEQSTLGRQRYGLAQAVDVVERTLSAKRGELTDTLTRLDDSRDRVDSAQQRLDGFDSAWSRFRKRDTIDTLHRDIDRSSGWVSEYETRAATLRTEISLLTGERDRAVAQRDAIRPGLVDRTREIRSELNADALLRIDRMEREPPACLRAEFDATGTTNSGARRSVRSSSTARIRHPQQRRARRATEPSRDDPFRPLPSTRPQHRPADPITRSRDRHGHRDVSLCNMQTLAKRAALRRRRYVVVWLEGFGVPRGLGL